MCKVDVSIVIISWNTEKLLKQCIESIFKHTLDLSYEIIVVDNNSQDGTVNMLASYLDLVTVIKSEENVGFGRAHKLALPYLNGTYTLLLNPDTYLKENSIKLLLNKFKSDDSIGLISSKLLNEDGTLQVSCWNMPSIKEVLVSSVRQLVKIPFELSGKLNTINELKSKSGSVDCVMGAVMLLSTAVFQEMGGFDDDYFMYGEDTDICWLIHERNMRVYYFTETEIYHLFGQSSKQINYWREVKTVSAMKLFLKKRRGKHYLHMYIFLKIITNLIQSIVVLPFLFSEIYRYKLKHICIESLCYLFDDSVLDRLFKL